jgi:large subunit ribosomal protein L5
MSGLKNTYKEEVRAKLAKDLGIKNPMAVPVLEKIVVNCGLGEALNDKKVIDSMSAQLAVITGQKPMVTKARRAISTFKLREQDPIGLKVTLRGKRMYDFLTRLVIVALPRVRDFRGVSRKGFDSHGNYTLGIREQTIFPDLEYKLIDRVRGFEITFVTSAATDGGALKLLEALGMPFEKKES